jgi:hypothetical protein
MLNSFSLADDFLSQEYQYLTDTQKFYIGRQFI